MLILASNTDKLQIVTSSAGILDVHTSWMDNVSGAVAPGRTNTANINAAATTVVVNSPASGVFRNVKTINIRNRGTVTQNVTVQHTDGTTTVDLWSQPLPANATLQYVDDIGFR